MKKLFLILGVLLLFILTGCQSELLSSFFPLESQNAEESFSSEIVVESPPLVAEYSSESSLESLIDIDGEMRAVWITQFELNTIRSSSDSVFRSSFAAMMKNCADFGLNTVFVQVRPNGDSFYPSEYYPWSVYASGNAGMELKYDPLAIMIEEAHRYGIEFHAWVNPYRLQPESQMQTIDDSYQTRQWYHEHSSNDRVVVLNGICYLNPGYSETRELIFKGVEEIVSRYNVDGIHIDDYFYPTTDESFDALAYQKNGAGKSLRDFRTDNVNQTVQGIYQAIKQIKPEVVFGVSPAGNMSNNSNLLYADTKLWTSNSGYLDYIIPQLYWNYDHPTAPFDSTVVSWSETVTSSDVKIVPGLAPYKISNGEWSNCGDVLARMVKDSRKQSSYGGIAFYSYSAMFLSNTDVMKTEKENLLSLFKQ